MKKRALFISIATIALCLAIIAGSTYALFTAETDVNVAVTAGNVKLEASLSGLKTYSRDVLQDEGDECDFELGGAAAIDGRKLTIDRMAPMDKAVVTVNVQNDSDIVIKYKVRIYTEAKDGVTDLAPALTATAKVGTNTYAINGTNNESDWILVDAEDEIGDIEVVIEFPNDDDDSDGSVNNDFQGAYTDVYVQIVAVQGNGTDIYDANN